VSAAGSPRAAEARYPGLNLARRPFVNSRPVTRVALLLWAAGLLLLLVNVSLFWSYFAGSEEMRSELAGVREQVETEKATVARLDEKIKSLDLASQNEQVLFLNGKIAERTFSWSLLFDRLAGMMPNDLRLERLVPRGSEKRGAGGSGRGGGALRSSRSGSAGAAGGTAGDQVVLTLRGQSRNDEALYRFVDNLFGHPAFDNPDLTREDRGDDGLINFDLEVIYLPGASDAAAADGATAASPTSPTPPIVVEEVEPQ
jgi:hypothetical protein